ncbi:response regulator [Brevundimonas vesicularis]|uniref:Response regulator n=1 Tax=Brevundimonas vesicularis TaxID=41276 RepID=A0A1Z3U9W5_BREVE|nr:response regulator [Brevundimonas vesicularis]ASE39754.1 response regulator [Brevundimonas vesicularis]MDX2334946.1 response regulator [Brevundimonas vesicularis]
MFDRPPPSQPDAAEVAESVDRLCRLYDSRLAETGGDLSPEDARELKAMAAIYDLDTDRPSTEVWRDLRAVVTRQAPIDATAPAEIKALTLLVVEDDPDAAASLTELLTEAGHNVVGPFHSAAAAEAAAALHSIDAALLDINLSGEMTGVELARVLTDRWGVRVIFISGDVAAAAKNADMAEALVLKPYNGAQILEAVARLA